MGGYKYISFFAKMKTVDIKIELMKMKKLKKNFQGSIFRQMAKQRYIL